MDKKKTIPIIKIQDLLLKIEGVQCAIFLDLNMEYYHIELDPQSKLLCTIVLPWGKYEYQKLPMGLCNSTDIFQEKMNIFLTGFKNVCAYTNNILVLTKISFDDHLVKLDNVINKLKWAGPKINANKPFFAHKELRYLGYWITREGILPIKKNRGNFKDWLPYKPHRIAQFYWAC